MASSLPPPRPGIYKDNRQEEVTCEKGCGKHTRYKRRAVSAWPGAGTHLALMNEGGSQTLVAVHSCFQPTRASPHPREAVPQAPRSMAVELRRPGQVSVTDLVIYQNITECLPWDRHYRKGVVDAKGK